MGRRSEQRIAISSPAIVHGSDSRGNEFTVVTETFDISLFGACVKGLNTITEPGGKIDIEFGDQNAWYGVQGSARAAAPRLDEMECAAWNPANTFGAFLQRVGARHLRSIEA
jgi:hypothetical protein